MAGDAVQGFNLNNYVWVRLSDQGRERLLQHYQRHYPPLLDFPEVRSQLDPNAGWLQFQLYDLMSIFGEGMVVGFDYVPFVNNEIVLSDPTKDGER